MALRPLFDIKVDPLIALPLGGLIGALCMGKLRNINSYAINGLSKMTPVAIMLLGTGALAGIIANSGLKEVLIQGLEHSGLPSYILAPISGGVDVFSDSFYHGRYCGGNPMCPVVPC